MRDAAPSKVLQSEVLIYLMAAFACGCFCVLIVKPMLPCLVIERNTTETLWVALRTLELRIAMGTIKRFFKEVQRIVTTDDHKSNPKHERAIAKARQEERCLHLLCRVHMTGNTREWIMMVAEEHVKKIRHLTLSIRGRANHAGEFRRALGHLIDRRMRVLRDRQPSSLIRRRNADALEGTPCFIHP